MTNGLTVLFFIREKSRTAGMASDAISGQIRAKNLFTMLFTIGVATMAGLTGCSPRSATPDPAVARLEEKVKSMEREMSEAKSAREASAAADRMAAWAVAVKGTRQMIAGEMRSRFLDLELANMDAQVEDMQRAIRRLPPEIDKVRLKNWQAMWERVTNSIAFEIHDPVYLEGVVTAKWPEGTSVESSQGASGPCFPEWQGKKLVQRGYFLLRGLTNLGESTHIRGTGLNPLPVFFTNRIGKVVMTISYDYRAVQN